MLSAPFEGQSLAGGHRGQNGNTPKLLILREMACPSIPVRSFSQFSKVS